jgi:hypothetical protein
MDTHFIVFCLVCFYRALLKRTMQLLSMSFCIILQLSLNQLNKLFWLWTISIVEWRWISNDIFFLFFIDMISTTHYLFIYYWQVFFYCSFSVGAFDFNKIINWLILLDIVRLMIRISSTSCFFQNTTLRCSVSS